MKKIVEKILNEYIPAKQQQFAGHKMGSFFRNEIPNYIYSTGIVNAKTHLIAGSVGQGNWATVPWVCIFDRKITTSATKGVYIVYLLSKDGNTLYLTLNQGCTDIYNIHGKSKAISIMRERASEIVSKIDSRGFSFDESVNLGSGLTVLAELYQRGMIFYKAYHKGNVPSDDELLNDLHRMMDVYEDYVSKIFERQTEQEWWPSNEKYNPGFSKEKWLELLNNSDIFTDSALKMIAEFYAYGGTATCAQLAEHYHKTYNYYLMTSIHLAERIVKATGCPVIEEEKNAQNAKWWPVLYVGKDASKEDKGTFVWRIRDELHEALTEYGIEKHLSKEESSKIGTFDSWEIIDESTAIKTCDKSFFEHNGSGVPKGICWFFDADDMQPGETKTFSLVYGTKNYPLKVANDSTDRRRVRVFWTSELGKLFNENRAGLVKVAFAKTKPQVYEITLYGGVKEMTIKDNVNAIKTYIYSRGFNYDGALVENFYLSLKAKPFVILAGTSGTGKTRLVRLFAEAINAEYKLVSVRPDWSDSSDLFGHVDLNQKFVPGTIIDFVKQAELNPTKPYFLCLDEMNLARVEYYMSDILSTIETRRYESNVIVTDSVDVKYGNDSAAAGRYGKLILPGNLYIVGTVNMDETTFPFSKKVLDRANTIEFSYVDLLSMPTFNAATANKISVTNDFLVSEYITLNDCDATDKDYIISVCTALSRINSILEIAGAHIGYRVRDEIVFYMVNNLKVGLLDYKIAFDNQIMQKILPRIQGSSESIRKMLDELLKICESENYDTSAKKIKFMMKRYEEDGFTSYWI